MFSCDLYGLCFAFALREDGNEGVREKGANRLTVVCPVLWLFTRCRVIVSLPEDIVCVCFLSRWVDKSQDEVEESLVEVVKGIKGRNVQV